jgi:putative tricarboxylic transport membrane protein
VKVNDALTGAALVALGATVLWHIQGFPKIPGQNYGAAWFPGWVASGLILCGALLIAGRLRAAGTVPWSVAPDWMRRPKAVLAVASIVAGLLTYVFLAETLGFHLVAAVLLLTWCRLLDASWRLALPTAVVATVLIHLAFYKLLKVPLPWGVLERFAF